MPEDYTPEESSQSDAQEDDFDDQATLKDHAQRNWDQRQKFVAEEEKWRKLATSDDSQTRQDARKVLQMIADEKAAQDASATSQDIRAKRQQDVKTVATGIAEGTLIPRPDQQSMPQKEFDTLVGFVESHAQDIGPRVDAQKAMQNPSDSGTNGSK